MIISFTDPKWVSANAKQFASFSIFIFRFKIFSRSIFMGLLFRLVEFEFLSNLVFGSIVPGVPIPIFFGSSPESFFSFKTISLILFKT